MSDIESYVPNVALLVSGNHEDGTGGSTMERYIIDSLEDKEFGARIAVVICNNARRRDLPEGERGPYDRIDGIKAKYDVDIPIVTINRSTHPDRNIGVPMTLDESAGIYRTIVNSGADHVFLQGYMKPVNGIAAERFLWKPRTVTADRATSGLYIPPATNQHPAVLPETAGKWGVWASLLAIQKAKAGELDHSAMTWQVAAEVVDAGPKIREIAVPIKFEADGTEDEDTFVYDPAKTDEENAKRLFEDFVQKLEKKHTAETLNRHARKREQWLREHAGMTSREALVMGVDAVAGIVRTRRRRSV